jgi:hypothetical protein
LEGKSLTHKIEKKPGNALEILRKVKVTPAQLDETAQASSNHKDISNSERWERCNYLIDKTCISLINAFDHACVVSRCKVFLIYVPEWERWLYRSQTAMLQLYISNSSETQFAPLFEIIITL